MDILSLSGIVGAGLDLWGTSRARKAEKRAGQEFERQTHEDIALARAANKLANAEIDLRMKQEELAFEEDTLASVQNLREVMASQRAIFASQGRMPGVGSTGAIQGRAMGMFASNERSRKATFGFNQHFLKSQQAINNISTATGARDSLAKLSMTKSKLKASRDKRNLDFGMRTFNKIPFNTLGKGKGLLSSLGSFGDA